MDTITPEVAGADDILAREGEVEDAVDEDFLAREGEVEVESTASCTSTPEPGGLCTTIQEGTEAEEVEMMVTVSGRDVEDGQRVCDPCFMSWPQPVIPSNQGWVPS